MLKRYFAALLASGLASHVVAENPPPITECLKDLTDIYQNENAVTDTKIKRTYTLCPNTVFQTGVANQQTGQIEGGQTPIVTRANAHVKCGDDGRSSNGCVIDGTGNSGIFQVPFQVFQNRPTDSSNVIFEGLTIDFWVTDGQLPVVAAAHTGDVTFKDCVWTNNNADPLFLLSELSNGQRSSTFARSAPQAQAPGFLPFWNQHGTDGGRSLYDADSEMEPITPTIVNEKANITVIGDRILQQTGLFKVTFEGCLFDFNDPVRSARSQGGLSLIRFTGSTANGQGQMPERFGTIDGELISNQFVDNIFDFDNDAANYRSIVDFFSEGKLTMKKNCFFNSPVRGFGVVTVQAGASLINQGNYIAEKQGDLSCEFIARLDQLYDKKGCGTPAAANKCLATPPGPAPTPAPAGGGGGFCFPGDATCQVEGQGQVLMKDLKLGDKVLVQGGKYEPVYSFGHRAQEVEALYLKFVTTAARSLELSKEHMVFIEGGRSVPASHVKVGDKLELTDGELATVKVIRLVQKQGAYAPFTASGTVIVNGVKASSFVSFQDSETLQVAGIDTGLTFQFLAYNFEMPHRMWCQYFSACIEEHYTTEGVSVWVDLPHKAALWYVDVNSSMVMTMAIGFLFLACIAMIANPVASLITLAAILVAIYRPGRFLHLKSAKSVHS